MFTPFWGKHDDSEVSINEEEFENHGFSDFYFFPHLLALMNPSLIQRIFIYRLIIKSSLYSEIMYLLFMEYLHLPVEAI